MQLLVMGLVGAALTCSACGTSGGSNDDGPLRSVADTTSQTGAYDVSMLAHSSSLTRGDYTLQLVITDKQTGAPVDDLALTIVPWMPAMGHGTAIKPTVVPLGTGMYEVDDASLFMPGEWELRTTIASPADYAAPNVQVH